MNHSKRLYIIFLLLCLPFHALSHTPRAAELQSQVLIQPGSGEMPLLPYLDYYIDETLSMDIDEAAAPGLAASYRPLAMDKLPRVEGITWLRFTISPLPPETRPATFLLDMGQSIPGVPVLFEPEKNELSGALEWHENLPAHRNILLLPEEGPQPVTCYIKLNGLPGPWFSPIIRTPQNAASNLLGLSRSGAILALAVVMILCLLRGASESGQWRFWTALYVAMALAQALLGMPETTEKFGIFQLAAVLLPGIALMLLPHVGRHLLNSPRTSRKLDIQLFLLSLPGAVLALLPLVPGWHWLDRWIDLWPAATIIFIPTALGAWIAGLPGAKRFLLACLVPPAFVAFAWAGLDFGFPANFLSSFPVWGVALSALLLVTGSACQPEEKSPGKSGHTPENRTDKSVINLENPLGDPHLRLVEPPSPDAMKKEQPEDDVVRQNQGEEQSWLQARENALREPLDEILRQGAALGECSLPPAVRQYAEQMIASACNMADIMSGIVPVAPGKTQLPQREEKIFNLQHLLRQVHNSVAASAETTGTAISWFMPPHLGRIFKGYPDELKTTLSMLLESAIRGSRNGSVHLTARRVPESPDEGHLLFSITDNGPGVPPRERSTLAITRAWEMIGRTGGYMAVEAAPSGVSIALSLRLEPAQGDEETGTENAGIILASDDQEERRALMRILSPLHCHVREAGSIEEVLNAQRAEPVPLLIAAGNLAMPSSADMTTQFAEMARNAGFAHSNILAMTVDDSQWTLLKPSGFTHAMIRSNDAESITKTITDLLQTLSRLNPAQPETEKQPEPAKQQTEDESHDEDESEQTNSEIINGQSDIAMQESGTDGGGAMENVLLPHEKTDQGDGAFEGPDWLADIDRDELPNHTDNPANQNDFPDTAKSIPTETEERFTEWVGEPVPIVKDPPSTDQTSQPDGPETDRATAPEKQHPDRDSAEVTQNIQSPEKREGSSFLDYIVGVGKKLTGNSQAPATEESKDESMAGAPPPATEKGLSFAKKNAPAQNELENEHSPESDTEADRPEPENKTEMDFSFQSDQGESEETGDPLIQELVHKLDETMDRARKGNNQQNCPMVAEATKEMANTAEHYGLRLLARMARCVERAARANDLPAISDLLPDLETATERNRLALMQKNINK